MSPSLSTVLKCRFYYYSGIVGLNYSGDECLWKDSWLQFLRGGGTPCHSGPHGEAPGQRQRDGGGQWARSFTAVSLGTNQCGRVSRLRIGQFGLSGIRAVPPFAVLVLGQLGQGGDWRVVAGLQVLVGWIWEAGRRAVFSVQGLAISGRGGLLRLVCTQIWKHQNKKAFLIKHHPTLYCMFVCLWSRARPGTQMRWVRHSPWAPNARGWWLPKTSANYGE